MTSEDSGEIDRSTLGALRSVFRPDARYEHTILPYGLCY
jgi:hypothetical protein